MFKRRTSIWLVVIFSLVSIAITVLNYFGIFRYMSLHIRGLPSYIENYAKLPKVESDDKVIVGLTAPKNANWDSFKPVTASILDQTTRVDKLVLFVDADKTSQVPEELRKIFVVIPVASTRTDTKDNLTRNESEADTVLISLNPSIIYGKDFLERLLENSKNHENVQDHKHLSFLLRPRYYTNNNEPPVKTFNYIENYRPLRLLRLS